ncbi:MAG: hypothetical protein PPHEMADM_3170 [uncultured Paraburkholderia sp.]|nr:MAG: hypothetical protein PPHEMADE_3140 [uncultured Paraburkholderia sp.]CAH2929230.1 MAG: hypothetical protein PPHEMADM_3170 [uncultured Paraburkholderia sp.]
MSIQEEIDVQVRLMDDKGKSYANPKAWNDPVSKGDIFVVTHADAANNNIHAEGDYFIAQFDGVCGSNYYPAWGSDNSKWRHAWSALSDFRLLFETGSSSGSIYGNSLNQIGVRAYYTPIDENGIAVPLSAEVLRRTTLTLLDYTNDGPLPGGWSVSTVQNGFHSLPESQQFRALERFSSYTQQINTYYISCGTDEPRRSLTIGSKITLPGGGVVFNSQSSFHNPVFLRALTPIFYVSANTNLDREDTASTSDWDQDNYYFTIKESGYYVFRADITRGVAGPQNWSIISRNKRPSWHYIWQLGAAGTAQISPLNVNIRYNQRSNAVCLTRLYGKNYNSGYDNWYYQTRFVIYDQYGNNGLFSAVRNEADWGNTILVIEGDHTSKG